MRPAALGELVTEPSSGGNERCGGRVRVRDPLRRLHLVTATSDWRSVLLAGAVRVEPAAPPRNPVGWPRYTPRPSVSVWRLARGPVAAVWDFSAYGGSFGEQDATALCAAAEL